MKRDLPTPDQMLEDLADKVAAQIDRLAPAAFDSALSELLRHHRFLLAINATRTDDGTPFNFAEIAGLAWRAPHDEWLSQYRRLYERAVERLDEDGDFLAKLVRVPTRLLPKQGDPTLSSGVLRSIVNLGPVIAHRLEAWAAKRLSGEGRFGPDGSFERYLVGSDRKTYEAAVADFVGAWESFLQLGASIFVGRIRDRVPPPERWSALSASWPFLWQHLTNTAYLLAVAVWNDDESGAELYRDALVRWLVTLGHDRSDQPYLVERRLLFPDVLRKKWSDALTGVTPLLPDYLPPPTPDQLFNSVVRGAYNDVVLLAASLLTFWSANEKRQSRLGSRVAEPLLRRQLADPADLDRQPEQPLSFRSLFLDFARLELSGERLTDPTYGAELDGLVAAMDNMTERRVISGRVYTPSTLHGRDELLVAVVALLLTFTPLQGDDGLRIRIERLASDEQALPAGDRSLRNLIQEFDHIKILLREPPGQLRHAFVALRPDGDFDSSSARLNGIVEDVTRAIEEERTARLVSRQPDVGKMERLRSAMEAAVLRSPGGVPFFRDFVVTKASFSPLSEPFNLVFQGITKAQLLEPPMETESSNMVESFAQSVQNRAGNFVWSLFCKRPREKIVVSSTVEEDEFWRRIEHLIPQVGPFPTLVISRQAEGRAVRRLLYSRSDDKPIRRIERRSIGQVKGNYIATVESVDVFGADLTPGIAWLFSGRSLRDLAYASGNAEARAVDLTYDPINETIGVLRVSFQPIPRWADTPTFEIVLEDPEDVE